MGIITKINAGGTDHLIASSAYGTCSTAANTAAKVVTLANFDTLTAGVTIHVRFTYSNTVASPTLNVNSKGAKPIYAYGTTAPGTTVGTSWQAGAVVSFTYNTDNNSSGCWVMNNYIADTDTDNDTKVTSSANHYTPSTASGNDKTASASGATAAWSIDVVKGITINTDGKGHITGLSVTSGKIPANPNSDTWRKVQLNGTDKLGTAISTNPLNLKAGTNMSITESSGTFTFAATDTNTTYSLSGALSSHKFTSTLTAGGSGSGTSTSDFTLAAGTGITITDDTSARKMTIACSVTNTDEKVSTAAVTSGTTYYPVVGADTTSAATKFYDKTGITYSGYTGTTQEEGTAVLTLGNSTAEGTAGNKTGYLVLYALNGKKNTLMPSEGAATDIQISLPQTTGTLLSTSNLSYTTSGVNRAVKANANGDLYVNQQDTNTYVTQNADTTNTWRKILGTYSGSTSVTGAATSGKINVTYYKNNDGPSFNPSTGTLYAPLYCMGLASTETAYTLIQDLGWKNDVII